MNIVCRCDDIIDIFLVNKISIIDLRSSSLHYLLMYIHANTTTQQLLKMKRKEDKLTFLF